MYLEMKAQSPDGLREEEIAALLEQSLGERELKRVLILPPDFTRYHSNAGLITCIYRRLLLARGCEVDIMPALGSHELVSAEQWEKMFPGVPYAEMIPHNWRSDVIKLGEVPGAYLAQISEGLWTEPISCEVNRRIMDPGYDLILSVGQVVPHEVIGMSNESKNLFVGAGGSDMINKSHMVSAVYDIERIMGKDHSPVRKLFDYCLREFLAERPVLFVLTVTTAPQGEILTHGVFIGDERRALESAIALSQQLNLTIVEKPIRKCVVFLPGDEFKTTWVGNKAVYRTRLAIADGGELLILAPGVTRFGEDMAVDAMIRKYGYPGRLPILEAFRNNADLRENMGAAAHQIMSSSDGRFSITYAVDAIDKAEIQSVGFLAADYTEMAARYDPHTLAYGWNTMPDGEEIFFVPNPALGLWIERSRFEAEQS